jgi:ABC-type nitrate/sulfonate/bicarbonate transport system permease component
MGPAVQLRRKLGQWAIQIGFLVAIVLAWHFGTVNGAVNPFLIPPIPDVLESFGEIIGEGEFWRPLQVTISEYVLALSISLPLALAGGYFVSRSRFAIRTFDPLITGLYAIPAIVLLPIYVLYFGLGSGSKIAIGATISFFPVILNTIAGFGSVDRSYILAARSMGASDTQLFWQVLLPAAFPVILTGLRLGLISAFLVVLGAETIASREGLGRAMVEQVEQFNSPAVFAYILFVLGLAFLVNLLLSLLTRIGERF